MLNQLTVKYLDDRGRIHDAQHGFRPGRGTLTAWRCILEKVISARDIYEFDLRKFFDLINLDAVSAVLVRKGIPVQLVRMLYYINTCAAQLKPPHRLNEFEHMMKAMLHRGSPDEVINAPRPLSYMYRVRGVPQGAPTSPLLATLTLEGSILDRPGLEAIMYADDGLYYGNIGDTPIITPNSGMTTSNIYFNVSKSGWVKRNGEWLKPLKFLGLEYDGVADVLRAKTRGGSDLLYDKSELVKAYRERENELSRRSRDSQFGPCFSTEWGELVRSKLFGFIQSRLYTGA